MYSTFRRGQNRSPCWMVLQVNERIGNSGLVIDAADVRSFGGEKIYLDFKFIIEWQFLILKLQNLLFRLIFKMWRTHIKGNTESRWWRQLRTTRLVTTDECSWLWSDPRDGCQNYCFCFFFSLTANFLTDRDACFLKYEALQCFRMQFFSICLL